MPTASDLAALTGPDEPVAVAVSGGPDSLALLLLAADAYGDRVRALTVDHALRPESAAEAAHVAAICAARGIAHVTLRWEGEKPSANLQAEARAARYRLMGDWCRANGVTKLLTAHHADDQAETILMRLARGAGLSGLSGIRARRDIDGIDVIRPLLQMRKAELVEIAARLAPVDDPSNRDPRHDRTQARALLRDTSWLDAERLAASAAHLAEAEAALDWATDLAWRGRVTPGDTVEVDAAGLPAELCRRLLLRALAHFGTLPDGPDSARLLATLDAGGTATLGTVKASGGTIWRFTRAPSRRTAPTKG